MRMEKTKTPKNNYYSVKKIYSFSNQEVIPESGKQLLFYQKKIVTQKSAPALNCSVVFRMLLVAPTQLDRSC